MAVIAVEGMKQMAEWLCSCPSVMQDLVLTEIRSVHVFQGDIEVTGFV